MVRIKSIADLTTYLQDKCTPLASLFRDRATSRIMVDGYAADLWAWILFWLFFYIRIVFFAACLPVLLSFLGELIAEVFGVNRGGVLFPPFSKAFLVVFVYIPLIRIGLILVAVVVPPLLLLIDQLFDPIAMTLQGSVRDFLVVTPRMWVGLHLDRWWSAVSSPGLKLSVVVLSELALVCAIFLVSFYYWKPYYAAWLAQS